MNRFINEFKPNITFQVKELFYDKNTQNYTLATDMPIISRLNFKSLNVLNNEMFVCKMIKEKTIVIKNLVKELEIEKDKFGKLFNLAFAITTHKSQGLTLSEPYVIYEFSKMNKRLRYVAISRASKYNYINII